MMLLLKNIFGGIVSKAGAIFGGIGLVILALAGAFFRGRKSKADEVQAETAETIIDTVKKVKENEKDTRNMSDSDKRDFLRRDASDN